MARGTGGRGAGKAAEAGKAAGAGGTGPAGETGPAGDSDARFDEAVAALIFGFLPWLREALPERWGSVDSEVPHNSMGQLLADITFVSGLTFEKMCNVPPASYAEAKRSYDALGEESGLALDCICFHGSSREAVEAIHEGGFDPTLLTEFACGKGAYVSQVLPVAVGYAKPDKDGLLWANYGRARLGDPNDIPVGSRGQTDFGVRADGRPRMTLTNRSRTYWCLKEPARQFISNGLVAWSVRTDVRPSDYALLNMIYPRQVWLEMKQKIPGLVRHKQRLLAEHARAQRKARARACWNAAVGRRTQPARLGKRARG